VEGVKRYEFVGSAKFSNSLCWKSGRDENQEHDRALMRVSVSLFNNRRDVQRLLDFLKPLA